MSNSTRSRAAVCCRSLAVTLLVCGAAPAALPVDYYLSSSQGAAANDGLSPERPWRDFAPLLRVTFAPGDRLLLKRGDTWSEQLTVHGGGTKEKPCTLGAYGSGVPPRVYRSGNRTDVCVSLRNPAGWHIHDLDLGRAAVGLSLFYDNSFDNQHVVVENLRLTDIDFDGQIPDGQADNNAWPTGISISGNVAESNKGRTVIRDVTIRNVVLDNVCNGFGVGFADCQRWLSKTVIRGLTIDNLDTDGGRSCGVHVRCTTDAVVRGCDAFGCGKPVPVGTCSAVVHDSQAVVWEDCELGFTAAPGSPDGVGFDFEGRNQNVTLRRMLLHDNVSSAILYYVGYDAATGVNEGGVVEDCVLFNDAAGPIRHYGGTITFRRCRIYARSRELKESFEQLCAAGKGVTLVDSVVLTVDAEEPATDLAARAQVSASSAATPVHAPAAATDGDDATCWQPVAGRSEPPWIELRFPEKTRLNKLFVEQAAGSAITRFVVRYWDGAMWRDAFNGRTIDGPSRCVPILPVITDRVRLVILAASGEPRIAQIQAYDVRYPWEPHRPE